MTSITAGSATAYAAPSREALQRVARRRRVVGNVFAGLLSVVLIIWTLAPIYNMLMVVARRP